MRKLSILLITIALVLVGCSEKKTVSSVKKDGPNIRGIVQEINDKTFKIQSIDRAQQGNVVVTNKVELKKGDADFNLGDTITVYYDKLEKGTPAIINKVYAIEINKKSEGQFIPAVVDEEGKVDNSNLDFYSFPDLVIVKGDKTFELSKENSAMIHDIIHNIPWENGIIENHKDEYKIMDDVEVVATFDSKTNILEDSQNEVNVKLHDSIAELLLKSIEEDNPEGR